MPQALVERQGYSPAPSPAPFGRSAEQQLFGGQSGGHADDGSVSVVHENGSVQPRFRELLKGVKGFYPYFRMGLVCQQSADPPFRLRDILLHDRQCLDYLVVGTCRNANCTFDHTAGVMPEESRIPAFMAKVKPVIAKMIESGQARADKKKKRRRT
jgi:hypothetical protein